MKQIERSSACPERGIIRKKRNKNTSIADVAFLLKKTIYYYLNYPKLKYHALYIEFLKAFDNVNHFKHGEIFP